MPTGAMGFSSLPVIAVSHFIQHIFSVGVIAEVDDSIVGWPARTMADFQPLRSWPKKGLGHQLMHAHTTTS